MVSSVALFGLKWVIPSKVVDELSCLYWRFGRSDKKALEQVPLCLMWTIWCKRNRRTFDGIKMLPPRLSVRFWKTLYRWRYVSGNRPSFLDFLDFLYAA